MRTGGQLAAECRFDRSADFGGVADDADTGGLQRSHLLGRGALAARDNGAGIAHAAPRRKGLNLWL